jgi:acyl carrier protein
MVLDDGRMLNLDRDRISRVIAPKLTGARNLHVHTRERPLQCFVLFGSVNASVGNSGQASYAAANAGLEQLARERRAAGLPATTIGWGMLGDAGYVAERPELVESVTQSGLSPLTTHDVREVLDFALTSEDAAIVAARVDWQRLSSRIGGRGSRAHLLSALLSGSAESAPGERSTSAAEEITAADPADRPALVLEHVRRTAGRVLGMPAARISSDRPLTEMGLDSLMGVELAAQTEAELGVTFPMSVLGHDLTIARIAESISRALGVPVPSSAPSEAPSVAMSDE